MKTRIETFTKIYTAKEEILALLPEEKTKSNLEVDITMALLPYEELAVNIWYKGGLRRIFNHTIRNFTQYPCSCMEVLAKAKDVFIKESKELKF